jgi:hypothetical protein
MIGQYVCQPRYIVATLNRYNLGNDFGRRPV